MNASKFGRGQLDIDEDALIIEVPKKYNYKYAFRKHRKICEFFFLHFTFYRQHYSLVVARVKRTVVKLYWWREKVDIHRGRLFIPHPFSGGIVQRNHKGGIAKLKPFRSCVQHVKFLISLKYIHFKFTRIATAVIFTCKSQICTHTPLFFFGIKWT